MTPIAIAIVALATVSTTALAQTATQERKPGSSPSKSKPTTSSRSKPARVAAGPTDVGAFVLTPPKGWKATPVTPGFRKAQFILPKVKGDKIDGELIVYFFGKRGAGSADANLARWGGQVKREPGMTEKQHKARSNEVVSGWKVTHVELTGTYTPASFGGPPQPPQTGSKMFAAVIETPHGNYYMRATGPRATLTHWKKDYRKMIQSIKVKKGVGEI